LSGRRRFKGAEKEGGTERKYGAVRRERPLYAAGCANDPLPSAMECAACFLGGFVAESPPPFRRDGKNVRHKVFDFRQTALDIGHWER